MNTSTEVQEAAMEVVGGLWKLPGSMGMKASDPNPTPKPNAAVIEVAIASLEVGRTSMEAV